VSDSVVVVSAGIVSAVGLSARETVASVRAATTRFAESRLRDKQLRPFTIAEVPSEALPPLSETLELEGALTARERRLLRLGGRALAECASVLGPNGPPVGLSLALPETETLLPIDRRGFIGHLATQVRGVFDSRSADASHAGAAGGLIAIGQAIETIRQRGAQFMIAGGIDTYRDLFVLGTLDQQGRVKSAANWDGFIPGEGAAFLLLASEQAAARHNLAPLARASPVSTALEEGHLYSEQPYRGDGLSTAIQQLAASSSAGPVGEVYSSMNGESHWAKEWGVSYIRNKPFFQPDCGMHHPADCCGNIGAASGPLMVCLAALGIKGKYRRSPCLIYGSSDRGQRAALIVSE
jgi:3-oxoacyl-[acyl-carrier-protein] synthase-1